MVFRMELTYSEIERIFDMTYIATSTIGYTLEPGIYEVIDDNLMLKFLFPHEVKVKTTIDDIRLRSNLTTNKTKRFSKRYIFFTEFQVLPNPIQV